MSGITVIFTREVVVLLLMFTRRMGACVESHHRASGWETRSSAFAGLGHVDKNRGNVYSHNKGRGFGSTVSQSWQACLRKHRRSVHNGDGLVDATAAVGRMAAGVQHRVCLRGEPIA